MNFLSLRSLAKVRFSSVVISALFILASDVTAETVEALPIGPSETFNESFDDFPKTSTSDIVGVTFGTYDGLVRNNSVKLANPPLALDSATTICLVTVTQDARFLADNPFGRRALPDESQLLATPITQSYESQLEAYDRSEIAIRAVLAEDETCYDQTQVFLPQIGSAESETLTVFINSRNRDGTIRLSNGTIGQGTPQVHCTQAGSGSRMAFDLKCQYEITDPLRGHLVDAMVELDDGFGIESIPFKVFIPSEPGPQE